MNKLIAINPGQVLDVWHLVEPGLDELISEGENPGGWDHDFVLKVLEKGQAILFLLSVPDENNEYSNDGFMILEHVEQENRMHIWLLWSKTKKSVMTVFNSELNKMCKNANCKTLTFTSTRDFWHQVAPRYNFTLKQAKDSQNQVDFWEREVI